MKDARGHGSNSRGSRGDRLFAGMKQKLVDDIAAGRMLASGQKSAPVPVHDAHTGSNYAGTDHPGRQYFNYYGTEGKLL